MGASVGVFEGGWIKEGGMEAHQTAVTVEVTGKAAELWRPKATAPVAWTCSMAVE